MATKKQRKKLGVGSPKLEEGDYETLSIDRRTPRIAWTPDDKGAPGYPFVPTWTVDHADLFKSLYKKSHVGPARWGTEMDRRSGRNWLPAPEAAAKFVQSCIDYPGIDWWSPALTSEGVVGEENLPDEGLGWLVQFLSLVRAAGYADCLKRVCWNLYDTHGNTTGPAGAAEKVRGAMRAARVVRKMVIAEIGHRESPETFGVWLTEAVSEKDITNVFAYLGRAIVARDRLLTLINEDGQLTERGQKFKEI